MEVLQMLRDFNIKLENAHRIYVVFSTNEVIYFETKKELCDWLYSYLSQEVDSYVELNNEILNIETSSSSIVDMLDFNGKSKKSICLLNNKNINPMDTFFACAENKYQVVEIKNVDLKIKKYNSFSNAKKYNLSYDKNIFSNGSAAEKVGPFFDYIKRYIITIKSYFDYFIERKYKCRIFAT